MNHSVASIVEDPELVQKRRAQIVAAATDLFSKKGFYRTTIKEVAKLAGISSGLVYQYVREKDDVLLLVILDVLDAYTREIPIALKDVEDPLQRLMTSISAYCRVVDQHRAATLLAYRSTKSLSPEKRLIIQSKEVETNKYISREFENCIRRGLIQMTNVDVLTYQTVMNCHAWSLKSWYLKSRVSLDEYIDLTLRNMFLGILTPVGKKKYETLRQNRGVAGRKRRFD